MDSWGGEGKEIPNFGPQLEINPEIVLNTIPWLLAVAVLLCWLRLPTVNE